MEVIQKISLMDKISKLFLKESRPFIKKREVNWPVVKTCAIIGIIVSVGVVLFLPSPKEESVSFYERAEPGSAVQNQAQASSVADPTEDTLRQLQNAQASTGNVPASLDHLYQRSISGGAVDGGRGQNKNSSMILPREDGGSKWQLPPGIKIAIHLIEKAVVSNQAMPIMGIAVREVVHENDVAIPQGAKLLGEISFDEASERAQITWRMIRFPDGRERQISAISVDGDGQIGIEGKIRSNATQNAIGQTLTRFIGAYAEGSMNTGQFGANAGGSANGLKNAVAKTAEDRANAWGEDLKKEKKWIELKEGTEFFAVLNQAFTFKDPGSAYGR